MVRSLKNLCFLFACLLIVMVGVSYGASEIPALKEAGDAERDRVQALIKGARAEGKLVLMSSQPTSAEGKHIIEGFNAFHCFQDLKVEYTYRNTAEIVTTMEQLMEAKRPLPDIIWSSSWDWFKSLIARGKIMRYESPRYKEYTLSNKAGFSMPGYWVADGYCHVPVYNVKAVSKAGIKDFNPTSWWDFADPKLAGLLAAGDICQSTSFSHGAIGLKKVLGMDWFRKIAKLKPALYSRAAQARDWVASGEYPISLLQHPKNLEFLRKGGVTAKLVYPKEGAVLIPSILFITADALHPNAAKLFIDYARSPSGVSKILEAGVYFFFGRPGVKYPEPDVIPGWENIHVVQIDMDKEITQKAIQDIQKMALDIGWSY